MDFVKSIELKEVVPDVTSGTPERVVLEVSQVMTPWIAVTVSCTSAGSVVLPTMKQAFACRLEMGPKNWDQHLFLSRCGLSEGGLPAAARPATRATITY